MVASASTRSATELKSSLNLSKGLCLASSMKDSRQHSEVICYVTGLEKVESVKFILNLREIQL